MAKKLTDVISEDQVRDSMTKQVLRSRLMDLAQRRIADPTEQAAFVDSEVTLTDEEEQTAEDIALLLSLDPTR